MCKSGLAGAHRGGVEKQTKDFPQKGFLGKLECSARLERERSFCCAITEYEYLQTFWGLVPHGGYSYSSLKDVENSLSSRYNNEQNLSEFILLLVCTPFSFVLFYTIVFVLQEPSYCISIERPLNRRKWQGVVYVG